MTTSTPHNGNQCPVCSQSTIEAVIRIEQLPVHCHVLCRTPAEALRTPRGDIDLVFCRHCGHVYNRRFEPALMTYTQSYENSLHFSPRFQQYAQHLATHLIERYDMHDKVIVEIGSGKGEFLSMLCEEGANRGFGFDPSYVPTEGAQNERVTFVQDFYSERYTHYHADLICCRHVLEHIQHPQPFMASVRKAVHSKNSIIFFEVPNVAYTIHDMGIWDIIYEHCSYFSAGSLDYLFQTSGFRTCDLRTEFGGQFLAIEAQPDREAPAFRGWEGLASLQDGVRAFGAVYREQVAHWQAQLAIMAKRGQRAVVWGAGSKGVTFINTVNQSGVIEYVVDLNPRKHGMHIVGGAQPIVAPTFLEEYKPDCILVMNPLYKDEIRQASADLGLSASIICV